jgi:hypothetical protein
MFYLKYMKNKVKAVEIKITFIFFNAKQKILSNFIDFLHLISWIEII